MSEQLGDSLPWAMRLGSDPRGLAQHAWYNEANGNQDDDTGHTDNQDGKGFVRWPIAQLDREAQQLEV